MHVGQALVLVGIERGAAQVVRGSQAGLGLDRAQDQLFGALLDQREAVGLTLAIAIYVLAGYVLEQRADEHPDAMRRWRPGGSGRPQVMQAYKVLGWISLGLKDGRTLMLRPQDYVPPSFATANGHQIAQWLSMGAVQAVANAKADRLAQADLATTLQPGAPASSFTVDGMLLPVDQRTFPLPDSAFDPPGR